MGGTPVRSVATGYVPSRVGPDIHIMCFRDVLFCWRGVPVVVDLVVFVPHQGAAVPDSRSLSWSFTFSGYFRPHGFVLLSSSCLSESSYGIVVYA